MAFVSLIFIFFAIIIIIAACVSPLIGIALFIISAVMKKKQLTKKKEAELAGNYSYQIKKTYIIPRVFGFIFMIPLVICIILVVYISIKRPADKQTAMNYIEENSDTASIINMFCDYEKTSGELSGKIQDANYEPDSEEGHIYLGEMIGNY